MSKNPNFIKNVKKGKVLYKKKINKEKNKKNRLKQNIHTQALLLNPKQTLPPTKLLARSKNYKNRPRAVITSQIHKQTHFELNKKFGYLEMEFLAPELKKRLKVNHSEALSQQSQEDMRLRRMSRRLSKNFSLLGKSAIKIVPSPGKVQIIDLENKLNPSTFFSRINEYMSHMEISESESSSNPISTKEKKEKTPTNKIKMVESNYSHNFGPKSLQTNRVSHLFQEENRHGLQFGFLLNGLGKLSSFLVKNNHSFILTCLTNTLEDTKNDPNCDLRPLLKTIFDKTALAMQKQEAQILFTGLSLAVFIKCGKWIYFGHIGDISMNIISCNGGSWDIRELSGQHRLSNQKEYNRVCQKKKDFGFDTLEIAMGDLTKTSIKFTRALGLLNARDVGISSNPSKKNFLIK